MWGVMRYCDMAADLLVETADFFVRTAADHPDKRDAMADSAGTYRHMADLIRSAPAGVVEHLSHAEMAARLLEDAAVFFEGVVQVNPMLSDVLSGNVAVFRSVALKLRDDPLADAGA